MFRGVAMGSEEVGRRWSGPGGLDEVGTCVQQVAESRLDLRVMT